MQRIFKHLEAGCLQVNLMSTNAQINQLKYTILYYTTTCYMEYLNMDEGISACISRSFIVLYNNFSFRFHIFIFSIEIRI